MKDTLSNRVSVLETKLENLTEKLDDVRADIKEVHACIHKTRDLILDQIKTLRDEENKAHKEQNTRITALENWRWYIIGIATAAGIAVKYLFGL